MKKVLFFFTLFFFQLVYSQQVDFLKIKKYQTAVFSDTLNENSGMTFVNGNLFTINDSGNSSEIFKIDKGNGKILKAVSTGLKNIDWEAITSDSLHYYIGDFGNNSGNRIDLKIYKIPFDGTENIQELSFFYPEQKDFSPKNLNTNFDAESMIFLNGKIHIFTKEWASKATSHYILDPEKQETQAVQKIEEYPTGFVVTDASYFNGKLYVVGYTKKTEVFLTVFKESKSGIFFKDKPQKYYLGSALAIGQIEGIAVNETGIYISGEKFVTPLGNSKPKLYFVPHAKLK